MIELKMLIDDMDYEALISRFLPQVIEKADPSELEPWARLLILSKGLNASTISKIMSRLPQEKRDELAARYINKNRAKLAETLTKKASERGLRVHIRDVQATEK